MFCIKFFLLELYRNQPQDDNPINPIFFKESLASLFGKDEGGKSTISSPFDLVIKLSNLSKMESLEWKFNGKNSSNLLFDGSLILASLDFEPRTM